LNYFALVLVRPQRKSHLDYLDRMHFRLVCVAVKGLQLI
jgi:hypothetical protein